MLSTTFLLSKTFLLSQFSPPSAAHAFNYNIPFIKNIPFITIYPPLCSPCFQLQHSFYQKHYFYHNFPPLYSPQHSRHTFAFVRPYLTSFYQNFPPPLQPMLSTTTFLLSKTFLLSQFSPPSAAHNIADTHLPLCDPTWLPFIKIFPPLCSPCFQLLHSFCQTHSFYQNFPPPLQPMLSTTTFLLSKTFLLSQFSPPLCSPQHSRHTFAFVRPYLTSFYQNFPPPLQPMLSTTTFLLTKTFLLSQFSPPLQPMLSTTFLLSKFSPPFAAHALNDSGYYGSSPNFLIHVQRRTEVGSHNTPYRPLYPE